MVEGSLGLVVEGLVCVLLVATIFYCIMVNQKLERLRREQKGMQSFIRDLSVATENADKAIQGLRQTVEASGTELAGVIEKSKSTTRALGMEIERAEHAINKLVVMAGSANQRTGMAAPSGEMLAPQPGNPVETHSSSDTSVDSLRRQMIGFEDLDEVMGDGPAFFDKPQK